MSKFRRALENGREALYASTRAKKEIQDVFMQLHKDIKESTDDKVTISLAKVPPTGSVAIALQIIGVIEGIELSNNDPNIVAAHPPKNSKSAVQLCDIKVSAEGYPVTLTFPGHQFSVYDRESLENALVALIEHPTIAGKIESVRAKASQLPPPVETSGGEDAD
jgi:hypothetical protein